MGEIPRGLERSEPGHRVVDFAKRQRNGHGAYVHEYDAIVCSCGWESEWAKTRKDGRINSYSLQLWNGHLDVETNQGLVVEVGIVAQKRVEHTYRVMTGDRAQDEGYEWRWGQHCRRFWAVCKQSKTKSTLKRKIVAFYTDRDNAIWKAQEYIKNGERDGHTITMLWEQSVQESAGDTTFRFVELADQALETRSLHDIELARSEMEKFFRLLPLIEGKRDELEALRNELLLGSAA